MQSIASPAGRRPPPGRKPLANRRSARAGEPAAGESVGASESFADVPHRPRLSSYPPIGPTDRLRDLYGSLSTRLGIMSKFDTRSSTISRRPAEVVNGLAEAEVVAPNGVASSGALGYGPGARPGIGSRWYAEGWPSG